MKTCVICGSAWSDRIDFCFYDGSVLVASGGTATDADDAFDAPSAGGLDGQARDGEPVIEVGPTPLRPIRLGSSRVRSALPIPPPPASGSMPRPGSIVEEVPLDDEATDEARPAPVPASNAPEPAPMSPRAAPDAPPPTITKRVKVVDPATAPAAAMSDEDRAIASFESSVPRRVPWLWIGVGVGGAVLLGGIAVAGAALGGAFTLIQVERVASRAAAPDPVVAAAEPMEEPEPVAPGVADPVEVPATDPAGEPASETPLQVGVQGQPLPGPTTNPPAVPVASPPAAVVVRAPNPTPPGVQVPNSNPSSPTPDTRTGAGTSSTVTPSPAAPAQVDASPWGSTEPEAAGSVDVVVSMDGPAEGIKLFVDGTLQPGSFPYTLKLAPGLHKFKVEGPGGSYEIGKPANPRPDGSPVSIKLIPPGG